MEYKVNLVGMTFSAVKLTKNGGFTIEFADGGKYIIEDPFGMVEGLLSDQKVLNVTGKLVISDVTNDLLSTVLMDPHQCASIMSTVFGGFLSKDTTDPKEKVRDFLSIIIENTETGKTITKGKGSWLS